MDVKMGEEEIMKMAKQYLTSKASGLPKGYIVNVSNVARIKELDKDAQPSELEKLGLRIVITPEELHREVPDDILSKVKEVLGTQIDGGQYLLSPHEAALSPTTI